MKKTHYCHIFTALLLLPVAAIYAQQNNVANILFPKSTQQTEIPVEVLQAAIGGTKKQSTLIVPYDSTYRFRWDTTTLKWAPPFEKDLLTRNVSGNIIKREFKRLRDTAWDVILRSTYTYDGNNNQLSVTTESFDNTNGFVYNWKELNTYDAKQNIIEQVSQKRDAGASTWLNVMKYVCSYDANNNRTDSIGEAWNGTAWVNTYWYSNSYEANGKLLSALSRSWIKNAWDSTSLYTYAYDAKNNRTQKTYTIKENNKWIIGHRYTYDYDADNNMIHFLVQFWDENTWKNGSQFFYNYDGNHNVLKFKGQSWNGSNSWHPFVIYYSATYNTDNTKESETNFYYPLIPQTLYSDSIHYYYHKKNSTIINANENLNAVHIYPNPSKGEFTIALADKRKIGDVAVYSTSGEKVLQQQDVNSLNITSFPKGIYFIRINDGGETYIRKIVLQ